MTTEQLAWLCGIVGGLILLVQWIRGWPDEF